MSRENLQELYDKLIEEIKRIDESNTNIDTQIEELKRNRKGALYALNKLGRADENQKKWVNYHLNKYVGAAGSFGINDMITRLEESKELQTANKGALTRLAKIYYAILNKLPQKLVDEPPEQDPDAPCNPEKPDFSFCRRTSIPNNKKNGGKGVFSIGDVIMVGDKLRIAVKNGKGMDFKENDPENEQWAWVGLQGYNWSGHGKSHDDCSCRTTR